MKKSIILTLVLLLALSGCAKAQPETTTAPSTEPVTSAATTAPTTVPTTAPTTAPTTKPTEPEPTIPDGATLLSKEELADFQAMMEQDYSVQDGVYPETNWYNKALGSEFASPAQVDLYRFFCDGAGGEDKPYKGHLSESELDFLYAQSKQFQERDIVFISAEKAEAVFQKYFGCSIADTDKVEFDRIVYNADTDRYYFAVGDIKFVDFTLQYGYRTAEGDVVLVADVSSSKVMQMTLRPVDGFYQVVSNLPVT